MKKVNLAAVACYGIAEAIKKKELFIQYYEVIPYKTEQVFWLLYKKCFCWKLLQQYIIYIVASVFHKTISNSYANLTA